MPAKNTKQKPVKAQQKSEPSDKANSFIDAETASKLDAFFLEVGWKGSPKEERFLSVIEALSIKTVELLGRSEKILISQKNEISPRKFPASKPHKATRFAKQFFIKMK